MESRDLSSSQSNSPANRDTTSPEDDAVLSRDAALARDAAFHFQSRRYVECLAVLYQLKQKKEDDPKVLHNIAIAEYFQDGCSDPQRLLTVLKDIKKKHERLSQASGEQAETKAANKVISGSKGSGTVQEFSDSNSSTLVFMDEFDPAVVTLNIAIIWFHLHEYTKALSVLEPLYHNIEPIDETIALHVCLLLLDVAMACQDPSKSADVLLYLEKAFGVACTSQSDNGTTAQQQSTNPAAKPSSLTNPVDSSNSDFGNSLENSLSLSEETLEYESMFSLDIGQQNLTRPSGLSSSTDFSRTQTDKSVSSMDLKLKLQLYKVRFLLLARNLKLAKREVKLAMNIARGRDSSTALLLKSQLEYARGNHRKAIKLLMASSNRTEIGNSAMYNNLGCIYYKLGKYHASSVLFSKALSSCSSLRKDKPLKLLTLSQDKSLLITYNCGVQYLACGKPLLAARCFQKSSLVFYNRPMLWVRLAECCLMALEKGILYSTDRAEITVYVIGKGKWRHLAIESGNARNSFADSSKRDDLVLGPNGQPRLSMSLARQCLLNALHLLDGSDVNPLKSSLPSSICLDENDTSGALPLKNSNYKAPSLGQVNTNGDAKEQKGSTSQEIMRNSISYFEDTRRKENQIIRQAILADLAYTELELENPEKALAYAKSLLEISGCLRIYTFLARVYAAEALCLLNKLTEAAECLSNYLLAGKEIELPFTPEDSEFWGSEKPVDPEESNGVQATANESQGAVFLRPEEAQGMLYADFGVIFAVKGETDQAQQFVSRALALAPGHPKATLTAVYVDIVLGKSQAAVSKLKQCGRVKFLPSRVQLNKA